MSISISTGIATFLVLLVFISMIPNRHMRLWFVLAYRIVSNYGLGIVYFFQATFYPGY